MFVRNVSIQLKPNAHTEFNGTFEQEILPTLRKQKGFENELVFGVPGATYVTAISFWDTKENADAYGASAYPEMLKKMSKFIEGTPKVRTAELIQSTFGQIAVTAALPIVPVVAPIDSKPVVLNA
jgi:hypothetical protein